LEAGRKVTFETFITDSYVKHVDRKTKAIMIRKERERGEIKLKVEKSDGQKIFD
jgi:hypothetical protein